MTLPEKDLAQIGFDWTLATGLLLSGGRMRLPKGTIARWTEEVEEANAYKRNKWASLMGD